jgi:5-methyltetrahydropteroyltriglutamate--homocysteine methyltransferase
VRDRVLEAANTSRLSNSERQTTVAFAPFSDDTSTPREVAFAKIQARVVGTEMAAKILGRN